VFPITLIKSNRKHPESLVLDNDLGIKSHELLKYRRSDDYTKKDYISGTQSTREVLANRHKMFVEKLDKMRSLGLYGPIWEDNIEICLEKQEKEVFVKERQNFGLRNRS
jgi:hypothetical protein